MRSERGMVGEAIVIAAVLLICVLPMQVFLIKALKDFSVVSRTKEILEIATINSFMAISGDDLGSNDFEIKKIEAQEIFENSARALFLSEPQIVLHRECEPKISKNKNRIQIRCKVKIISAFGFFIDVEKNSEFISELT